MGMNQPNHTHHPYAPPLRTCSSRRFRDELYADPGPELAFVDSLVEMARAWAAQQPPLPPLLEKHIPQLLVAPTRWR